MKKFTVTMIALLSIMVAFAAGPKRQFTPQLFAPAKSNVQLGQQLNAKQTPAAVTKSAIKANVAKARAMKKAATAADLVGDYTWDYKQSSVRSTQPDTLDASEGSAHVTIAESATTEGGITISGMFANALEATVESEDGTDYIKIAQGQLAGTSSYGDYVINGLFYYEGDEQNEAGWYYDDIYGYILEDGSIYFDSWFIRVLTGGDYDGYSLNPMWVEGSTLTPADPLALVTLPEGVTAEEYSVVARNYKDDADVSGSVFVGFDGNDVYIQGLSSYLPEAWVKGTLADGVVTFATGQYLGNYGDTYDMYLNILMDEDVVFDYDSEAGVFTAQNEFFLIDNSQYYFDSYRGCVIKKVVEKAVMPANPAITALTNGSYGWYMNFNVPTVDVNGDGMVSSKLSYMIYTDVERTVSPLTFTPDTHSQLTEEMTEIPYGFTEDYDFYTNQIYFNDLYSKDWNKIGIKSIYRGGDEVNETEIQWYTIKDYTVAMASATFNFNKFGTDEEPWPVSTNDSKAGDITADTTLVAETENGDIKLTISPAREEGKTATRYWGTNNGPQLRCYYNTLTIEAPENFNVASIVFGHSGYWGGKDGGDGTKVYADSGELTNDKSLKVATWTGDAHTVVITIDANTQINYITVTCNAVEAEEEAIDPEGITYTFDEAMEGWTTIDADGDGYDWTHVLNDTGVTGRNDSNGAMVSKSYENNVGALTPDNYLVSPKVKLGSTFSFFAVAQDAAYPAEHFGVFVSTTGKKAEDFSAIDEWELTAARAKVAPRKTPGTWHQYIVDMSAFEGEEGYVAIRHFDCTDNFYIVVDDITFGTPEEYTEPTKPDLVELPEGVETETWTLCALNADGDVDVPVQIGIDGTDMYIQGLGLDFVPDAWVKGTIDGETVTFPAGQFMGTYSSYYGDYDVYFFGYSQEDGLKDIVFTYDAENGRLATDGFIMLNTDTENVSPVDDYTGYYQLVEILKDFDFEPIAPVVPEGLETAEYQLTAIHYVEGEEDEETGEAEEVAEEMAYPVKVGFDGNDVYFIGLTEDFSEAVAKGTLSEDGKTVTIPANQFMGTLDVAGFGVWFYDYYLTSVDYETGEMADLVFNYDAEAGTLKTDQPVIINGSHKVIYPYDVLYNTVLTLIPDVAAVPADPEVASFTNQNTKYPNVSFNIPIKSVEGAPLLTDKLFYKVFYVKDNAIETVTLTPDLYPSITEDMTLIPYNFNDDYDVYKGGSPLYLNQEGVDTWTNIGVQSVYYGGDEENFSNIVWYVADDPVVTGITAVSNEGMKAVVYDLQGRRVVAPAKGLYIINSKKVVLK